MKRTSPWILAAAVAVGLTGLAAFSCGKLSDTSATPHAVAAKDGYAVCDLIAQGYCASYPGTHFSEAAPQATLKQACDESRGHFVQGRCPEDKALGQCVTNASTTSEMIVTFYGGPAMTLEQAKAACDGENVQWYEPGAFVAGQNAGEAVEDARIPEGVNPCATAAPSCFSPSDNTCTAFRGATFTPGMVERDCAADKGVYEAAICSPAGSVGCCASPNVGAPGSVDVHFYASGYRPEEAEGACNAIGGHWHPAAP